MRSFALVCPRPLPWKCRNRYALNCSLFSPYPLEALFKRSRGYRLFFPSFFAVSLFSRFTSSLSDPFQAVGFFFLALDFSPPLYPRAAMVCLNYELNTSLLDPHCFQPLSRYPDVFQRFELRHMVGHAASFPANSSFLH